jgi:hypothetical protein
MASPKQKNRNKKGRVTIETPEQIRVRREKEQFKKLSIEAEKREAAKRPENWGPPDVEPENLARYARANAEIAKSRERVKITFQALYECGTIRIHHAVAGNRCLDICQRMTGQVEAPAKPLEYVDGGLRSYEPVSDGKMTASLDWKRLSSAIGQNPSNILLRICMAWIEGVQIDWKEVVRTEYNLPVDSHAIRDKRYLSGMLLAALESAHQHFEVP